MVRKRPSSIGRRWFPPDVRVGQRQRACSSPSARPSGARKTQASWRAANPDYFAARRIAERAEQAAQEPKTSPAPLRVPAPRDRLPWDVAQDQLGAQMAYFIGLFG